MKKYKVLVIQHPLKNNKIAKAGDLVTEGELTGKPSDLIKAKFIAEVDSKSAKKDADAAKAKAEFDAAYKEGKLTGEQLDTLRMDDIYAYADEHKLAYDKAAKKAALIAQVVKAEKASK